MRLLLANRFVEQYSALSPPRKKKVDKQLQFLMANLRHPSLRAKKYDEAQNIWQARVDRDYRFYFRVDGDTYQILSVIPHPK